MIHEEKCGTFIELDQKIRLDKGFFLKNTLFKH